MDSVENGTGRRVTGRYGGLDGGAVGSGCWAGGRKGFYERSREQSFGNEDGVSLAILRSL